jgi:transglutaminase-like putative cysteine protease
MHAVSEPALLDGFFDEVHDAGGTPRPHAAALAAALEQLGPESIVSAGRRRDAIFMQQGITFDAAGPDADGPVRDRPFPLDLVPRIIPAHEWHTIKRGLAQRIRALNHFVDDVYHGREIVHDGVVPWDLIVSRSDVRARVATTTPADPPEGDWPDTETSAYRVTAGEFLQPFGPEPDDIRIDELVGMMRAGSPAGAVRKLAELIPDRFEYRAGVTYVGSTVEDLLAGGAGVCQDFAHLALLLLRRNGLAARYVSGYLFAPPEGQDDADSAEVDTHAWVEALLPHEDGGEPVWVGVDPTNRQLTGERHVKIGHGRHYSDVPPVKGVYRGAAGSHLAASVRMHRTDATGVRA